MTVDLAQQVAGVGEKVSDSNEHETEKEDEDSDGDWWAEIELIQFMMSLYAVQMLCSLTLKLDGHLAGTLIFSWHFTSTCSKASARDTKQYRHGLQKH
jgi:hypothetical protein